MKIDFKTSEKAQTLEEYNLEIAEAEAEIERGKFITAEDLKKAISSEPRKGWVKAFKRMAKNGDDKLLMPDIF